VEYNTSISFEKVSHIFDKDIREKFEFYKSLLYYKDTNLLDPEYLATDISPVSFIVSFNNDM